MRMILTLCVVAAAMFAPTPALAQMHPVVEPPASAAAAERGVTVYLLNDSDAAISATPPVEMDAVAADGARLRLTTGNRAAVEIPAHGFARASYALAAPARGEAPDVAVAATTASPAETVTPSAAGSSAAFIDRFRAYEPIYGVFGTKDGAKLQFSFAFRLLGGDTSRVRLNGAYSQTIFWALDRPSGPIRFNIYSPEVYAETSLDDSIDAAIGYRHDSNGRDIGSIDVNRVYLRGTKRIGLGGDWTLEVTPQAWFYVGNQGVATDLDRYWGYTSLTAAIGQADGAKIQAMVRGNPGTGKGAGEVFLSYPLPRIAAGLPRIYLFGQAFTGFGETLDQYRRRDSHARFGIAFTR